MDFPPPWKERVRRKKQKIRREREQRVAKNIFYMANGGPIEGEKEGMPQFTSMKVASVMNLIFKNKIVVLFNRRWDDWSLRNSLKKALKLHLISTSAKVNFRIGKNKIDSQFYRFFLSRRPELSGYSRVVKYINPHIIYIYIYINNLWLKCANYYYFFRFSLSFFV